MSVADNPWRALAAIVIDERCDNETAHMAIDIADHIVTVDGRREFYENVVTAELAHPRAKALAMRELLQDAWDHTVEEWRLNDVDIDA